MKKNLFRGLIILEKLALLASITLLFFVYMFRWHRSPRLEETSPDGAYQLEILNVGSTVPFTPQKIEVVLFQIQNRFYRTEFRTQIVDDGGPGQIETLWLDDSVRLTFSGQEQSPSVYILPFPSAE